MSLLPSPVLPQPPPHNRHCAVRKCRSMVGKIAVVFILSFLFALTLLTGIWIFGDTVNTGSSNEVQNQTDEAPSLLHQDQDKISPSEFSTKGRYPNPVKFEAHRFSPSLINSSRERLRRTKRIDPTVV